MAEITYEIIRFPGMDPAPLMVAFLGIGTSCLVLWVARRRRR